MTKGEPMVSQTPGDGARTGHWLPFSLSGLLRRLFAPPPAQPKSAQVGMSVPGLVDPSKPIGPNNPRHPFSANPDD